MTSDQFPNKVDDEGARSGLVLVLACVLLYSLVHVGFRLLASDVLGEDDVIDTILIQDLRAGYAAFPRQPPLYDWVAWCVQRVLGPGVEGFLLIKYGALIATAGFLYLSALRILKDRLFAILSVESLALIYQISWRYHEGFTHEVGAMVCVMATLWLFLRVLEYGRLVDFAALGIGVGCGLLSEPAFGVFFVSMLIAGGLQQSMRARVLRPHLIVTLVIAVVMASPYVWWVLSDPARIGSVFQTARYSWSGALSGVKDALRGPVAYLSPLLFILPVVFPGFLKVAWGDLTKAPIQLPEPDGQQLVLHTALVALGLSVVGALVFAIGGFAVHVLMPLYLTSVIWLFGVAKRAEGSGKYVSRFTQLAIGIAIVALFARLANMFILDPVCNKCRWGIPYAQLGVEMRARGFSGGTIVSIDHELAGNLRQVFPGAKIVTRRYPKFTPQGFEAGSGVMAFVWGTQLSDEDAKAYMGKLLPPGHTFDDAVVVKVPWRHLWKPDGYRESVWKLLIIDMDAR